MNVLEAIDREGEVTRISAQGRIAIQEGDTVSSARLFQQAAELLEASVADLKKPSERDLARFLAASHYYYGGHYAQAAKVCERIQGKRLPSRVRHIYPPFLKNVWERSAPDYVARYLGMLKGHYERVTKIGDRSSAQSVIEMLMEHPYLVSRERMAHIRAWCCDVLGRRRATTLFYRRAWQYNPDDPYTLPPYLDSLCKEGRHDEAWKIVEGELADHPGTWSSVYAILVRSRQIGTVADQEERHRLLVDLMRHLESAWRSYRSLTDPERTGLKLPMDWAFALALDIFRAAKDGDRQRDTLDRWIEVLPGSPYPLILRGMMSYPGEAANTDFRHAIRLGSPDPFPYYFLAHEALRSRNFQECDRLSTLALQRNPGPDLRAALVSWQAISRWNLGLAKPQEIRKLFNEAKQLKPDDPLIASYAQGFEDDERKPRFPTEIGLEGEERTREQAKRYVDELSKRDIEDMSPTLNLIAV